MLGLHKEEGRRLPRFRRKISQVEFNYLIARNGSYSPAQLRVGDD